MVSVSTGDAFGIAADDDIMDPVALSAVFTYLHNPWLVGKIKTNNQILGDKCTLEALLDANYIPCPAVFWTREAAIATGPFDPAHPYCFDHDYWIRMWKACGAPKFINHILSEYRNHPDQVTHMHAEAVRDDEAAVRRKHTCVSVS